MRSVKCRYFTGIQHPKCEAGVEYSTVKTFRQPQGSGIDLPCFNEPGIPCPKQSLYTLEELAAQEVEDQRLVAEFMAKINAGLCVECGVKYTPKQVGRCVYAKECGHRQYQGKADPKMSDDEYEALTWA